MINRILRMLREGSYPTPDGEGSVYYVDDSTMRDAADLAAVLNEDHVTGSPNLENLQARNILDHLQTGAGLGEVQIGTLRKLVAKHRAKITALRASGDREGQDYLDVADPGSARMTNPKDGG